VECRSTEQPVWNPKFSARQGWSDVRISWNLSMDSTWHYQHICASSAKALYLLPRCVADSIGTDLTSEAVKNTDGHSLPSLLDFRFVSSLA
jgi:hypothetical protein